MKKILEKDVVVQELVDHILGGGIIIMPTETSYGIIADANNETAIKKVYELKKRNAAKPLPVVCGSREQVEEYFVIDPLYEPLIEQYWPGPLTCVLAPCDNRIKANPQGVFDNTIAVRVTSHDLLQQLCLHVGAPLVATSANQAGDAAVYDVEQIDFVVDDVLIIDAGTLPQVPASTIVAIEDEHLVVQRQGPIKI